MDTSSNATPSRALIPVWYKIGAALLLVAVVVLFFVFAGFSGRHQLLNEVPPGGAVPGVPTPAVRPQQ
jgi:hypothetical protein